MTAQLTNLQVTAYGRQAAVLTLYVVVMLLAALAFAVIAGIDLPGVGPELHEAPGDIGLRPTT